MEKKFRKPYRTKKKKPIFRHRFFWLGLSILIVSGVAVYFAIFSSKFQIKTVNVSGNLKVQKEAIGDLIKGKTRRQLLFFSNQSIFLADSNEIAQDVLEEFPQIEKITIKKVLPDILAIEVRERIAVGSWCRKEECFLVDKTGVIFEKKSPDTALVIRADSPNAGLSLGQKVVEEELMTAVLKIERELKGNLKVGVEEFVILDSERMNVKTKEGWEIYFNQKGDIGWQLLKLKLVLEKEIPLEKREKLEYIELRFGNLAPYRYRP